VEFLAYAMAVGIGLGIGLAITRSHRQRLEKLAPTWRCSGLAAGVGTILFVALALALNDGRLYVAGLCALSGTLFVTHFFLPWSRARSR
jgi:hypothetical protein